MYNFGSGVSLAVSSKRKTKSGSENQEEKKNAIGSDLVKLYHLFISLIYNILEKKC